MKRSLLIMSVLLISLVSCEEHIISQMGEMSLNLTSEGEFTPIMKSSPDVVDINTFSVRVQGAESGKVVNSWSSFSEMPSIVYIEPGSYTIYASSPHESLVAWNQPIYDGRQDFTVELGKVINVDLVCKLSNMKVTVKCTEKFINELNDDFSIKVSNKSGFLIYDKGVIEKGETVAGYFDVNPLTVDIIGTRKMDKSVVSHHFTISEVAPQDHHIFTIDAHETGQIHVGAGGITVDYTVNNKDVDINVGELIEEPVEEDFTGAPVVTGTSVTSGEEVKSSLKELTVEYSIPIELTAEHGITLNSSSVTAQSDGTMLTISLGTLEDGTEYTLTIPEGAVINPEDQSPAEAYSLSFKTVSSGGDEEVEVPITIDVPGMDGCYEITNTDNLVFDLNVTAEKGIKNLIFDVLSETLKPLVIETLQTTTTVDLANMDEGQAACWGGLLNVTSQEVLNATTLKIELGTLISLLKMDGLANIEHKFHIKVVDNDSNEKESDVSVIVKK